MNMKVNYKEIGLMVGLEIHQMLNTKSKLFCECPTLLRTDNPHFHFLRKLRPTRSELGEMDPAALFEFKKGVSYRYEGYEDGICLVEMDEEPPHDLNREALEIALMISLMLKSMPVDELHVMRKIVIDGSNTTGFQRTALLAIGGEIYVEGKKIPIQTVCLEEDAARKIDEDKKRKEVVYRLDRMSIPLIEIATAPVINTPEEAERVAFKIGQLLRISGRVKRGLGTIRQDLNVSVKNGARIEIKGVQELGLISKIVEFEVVRQLKLLEIKDKLEKRGVRKEMIKNDFVDVSEFFVDTKSKIARRVLSRGGIALAVKLPGFAGLIGYELQSGRRLGTEFSDRAKYWADVGGIFHSDELPSYGITLDVVNKIKQRLNCDVNDAFVLIFEEKEKAVKALNAVIERAKEALDGVPEETRGANPDGTTRFLRPMPGKARMYPETDIKPIRITKEFLDELQRRLPEPPEAKYEKMIKIYKLSSEMARKMIESYHLDLFERIVEKLNVTPSIVASFLENTLVNLRREGFPVSNLSDEKIFLMFELLSRNIIAKEALPTLAEYLSKNPGVPVDKAVEELGLRTLGMEEVNSIIDKAIKNNISLIRERGERAIGPIMGIVMREVRGKVDGKLVSELVKDKINKILMQGK